MTTAKGIPVHINDLQEVFDPEVCTMQGVEPNGQAFTDDQLAQRDQEIAFKIWQRHWGRIFMKDNGSDYDESPDSQDCKDVFEEVYQASKKDGEG